MYQLIQLAAMTDEKRSDMGIIPQKRVIYKVVLTGG